MRYPTTLNQKILLLLIGLLVSLFLLEIGLRTAGWIYYTYRKGKDGKLPKYDDKTIRILCVGDSVTFGIGAPKGYSYPEQLEKLLVERFGNRIKVINKGIPGVNSSQILKNLPEQIEIYKPKIVTLLAGVNDTWNLAESNYYLFTSSKLKRNLYKLESLLMHLKIYKFVKIGIEDITFNIHVKLSKTENTEALRNCHASHISLSENKRAKIAYLIAEAKSNLCHSYNLHTAEEKLMELLRIDPNNDEAYFYLAKIYWLRNQFKEAEKILKKALQINPYNTQVLEMLSIKIYLHQGKKKEALEGIKKILSINPYNRKLWEILLKGLPDYPGNNEIFTNLIRYNLLKIHDLVKRKKLKLILQSYPDSGDSDISKNIRNFATLHKIKLVDHFIIFNNLSITSTFRKESYFREDDHPNQNGYGIMAKNVYNVLEPIIEDLIENKK